jgi:hypothetical protein
MSCLHKNLYTGLQEFSGVGNARYRNADIWLQCSDCWVVFDKMNIRAFLCQMI